MRETPHLIVTLTLVAMIAGLLVAFAEAVTRQPIQDAKDRAFTEALEKVLPPGVGIPKARWILLADGGSNQVYVAGGALAMEALSSNGYAGNIKLLVGFTAENMLFNYSVLDHKETPGLGAKIDGSFRASVTNRPAATTTWKVKKDGGDIDAITSATISSRAVCEAIAAASAKLAMIRKQ